MTCYDSPELLLYLLELTVENLELNADKIHESGDNLLVVKIVFLSMPPFVIPQDDFKSIRAIKSLNEMPKGKLDILSGISCLFSIRARDLVGEMQKKPLRIGIFCVGNTYPIAEATLPLTGCLCDQIAMALNDHDHMPEPYILHGRFGLLDPGKNSSGYINIKLKITSLGKHVITYYQMKKNSFVFKNDRDVGEYSVNRYIPSNRDEKDWQQKLDNEISESGTESTTIKYGKIASNSSCESPERDRRKKKKKKKKSLS